VWHESIGLLSAATASSPRVPGNAFEGRAHAVEHHLWCATPLEAARRGLLPRPAGSCEPPRSVSADPHDRGTAVRALRSRTCLQLETPLRKEARTLVMPRVGMKRRTTSCSVSREEQSSSGPRSTGVIAHSARPPSTCVPALLPSSLCFSGRPFRAHHRAGRRSYAIPSASLRKKTDARRPSNQKSANDESKRALAEDDDAPGSAVGDGCRAGQDDGFVQAPCDCLSDSPSGFRGDRVSSGRCGARRKPRGRLEARSHRALCRRPPTRTKTDPLSLRADALTFHEPNTSPRSRRRFLVGVCCGCSRGPKSGLQEVPARVPLPLVPKVTLRMSSQRVCEGDTRSLLSSKRPSASTRQARAF
jgi:hypothetical protein